MLIKKPLSRTLGRGYIDNSITFFITAILSAIILFEIGNEQPAWVWITGGLFIAALVIGGIYNILFGFHGMGSNTLLEDKKQESATDSLDLKPAVNDKKR